MIEPLVSIIVPVYNVELYLYQCLDSLMRQTYQNIEIIAVNDGSTDNSLSILEEYALRDSRIRVVNKKNSGLSDTRNVAIDLANGEFIVFVDSDDWLDTEAIEKAVSAEQQTNSDIVFWGYVKEFKSASIQVRLSNSVDYYDEARIDALYQRIVGPIGKQLRNPEKLDSFVTAWGKLYKTSIIKNNMVRFVSTKEIGTEDLLFNVSVFKYVKSAIILPACYSHYRKYNAMSLTASYKPMLSQQWQRLQDLVFEQIRDKANLLPAYYNRVALSIIGLGLNEISSERTIKEKHKTLSGIVRSGRFNTAFKQLEYNYMPLHWKLFFLCARYKFVYSLIALLTIMSGLIKRNNN